MHYAFISTQCFINSRTTHRSISILENSSNLAPEPLRVNSNRRYFIDDLLHCRCIEWRHKVLKLHNWWAMQINIRITSKSHHHIIISLYYSLILLTGQCGHSHTWQWKFNLFRFKTIQQVITTVILLLFWLFNPNSKTDIQE